MNGDTQPPPTVQDAKRAANHLSNLARTYCRPEQMPFIRECDRILARFFAQWPPGSAGALSMLESPRQQSQNDPPEYISDKGGDAS